MNEVIEINGVEYPATISGRTSDYEWDNRHTKTITLEMDVNVAKELFIDGVSWLIITEEPANNPENPEELERVGYDNSDFNLAGPITDYRNGTVSVKMGKLTELEEMTQLALNGGL